MVNSERPGVYTSYTVSSVLYSGSNAGIAGIAAPAESGTANTLYTVTSYSGAISLFGKDSALTELIRILFSSGVSRVMAVPIITEGTESDDDIEEAYEDAFDMLIADENVKVIVCGSNDDDIYALLKSAITNAEGRAAHKIGIVENGASVQGAVSAAAALNCERMVMVAPKALDVNGDAAVAGSLSAAVAGAILAESDPAVPLNGAQLKGIGGVNLQFNDGDIDTLVLGGVTPVECVGGEVSVVRGITTKTTTGGESDRTWRELSSILVVDDVIPTVREALKGSFSRVKNTAQTRGAIRTRVIIELEEKLRQQIIDDYGNVEVKANEDDPTICDVSFEFTVAHGLNKIEITAYITV